MFSKKEVVLNLLRDSAVFIHLDPRRQGVVVPQHLIQRSHLVLHIGLNMHVPINDLEVTDAGISCTLSFDRKPTFCHLPWSSIFALVTENDARGRVWEEDVPREVVEQRESVHAQKETPAQVHTSPPAKPRPSYLRRVK